MTLTVMSGIKSLSEGIRILSYNCIIVLRLGYSSVSNFYIRIKVEHKLGNSKFYIL